MSQKCPDCGRLTQQLGFVPCFKCGQYCCSSCVCYRRKDRSNDRSRLAPFCFKCSCRQTTFNATLGSDETTSETTEPNEIMVQPKDVHKDESSKDDLCKMHNKLCKLFCVNCSVAICGACMDGEGVHDTHQVTNLAVVHQEKYTDVELKLVRAEKRNGEQYAKISAYERNLQLLQEVDFMMRKEIDAIADASELELSTVINNRKKVLKGGIELPVLNKTRLMKLRSDVQHMSTNEFVQQYPEIGRKCDELLGGSEDVPLQSVDDIKCDLIPPYHFLRVVFQQFKQARNDSSQVFRLTAAHDVEWKLTVRKSATVDITLDPGDHQVLTFRHMLVVNVPHPDYTKLVRQTFELDTRHSKFEVGQSRYFVEQGFCDVEGDLVMMIGIRPWNSLIGGKLLVYQFNKQKAVRNKESRLLQSVIDSYDYNHLIMHFHPKFDDLDEEQDLCSFRIRDSSNRQWRLIVGLEPDDEVAAYVELFKGSAVNCSIFIELKHKNAEKTILKKTSHHFESNRGNSTTGWDLRSWNDLNNDKGFHPNGQLHFRFGVRPLENDHENSANSCAANA